ncbi:hypothetical protein [Pantoea ananatis]
MLTHYPFGSKQDVERFILELEDDKWTAQDINLFRSIFKLACLLNIVINNINRLDHKSYINGMGYDILNSIIAIINSRERYLYLNIRSMIEHIARIALDKVYLGGDFDGTVRRKDFDYLKKEKADEGWKYLHDTYSRACHYVHSSPEARLNVTAKFLDLITQDSITRPSKQIVILQKIVSSMIFVFIKYYEVDISSVFYRSQSELKYLLGSSLYGKYEIIAGRV